MANSSVTTKMDPSGENKTTPAKNTGKTRLFSLDWARGWLLIASVSVNSVLVMPAWFGHAKWAGIHPVDFIFPLFVTLAGVGLAFAFGRGVKIVPLLRRVLILFLIGLIYNAVMDWHLSLSFWRITGVLQLYAFLILFAGLLHTVTRSPKGWAFLTVIFAISHSTVLLLYAKTCSLFVLTPECNPSPALDHLFFGMDHIYARGAAGYDPEGVIVILGAMVSISAGAMIGHTLRLIAAHPDRFKNLFATLKPFGIQGVFLLTFALFLVYILPLAFGAQLPVVKKLWTAPFALLIALVCLVLVVLGHLIIDRGSEFLAKSRPTNWLVSLGRNSLLVYFGSHVLTRILAEPIFFNRSIMETLLQLPFPLWAVQAVWTITLLTFWIVVADILNKKQIYVRPK